MMRAALLQPGGPFCGPLIFFKFFSLCLLRYGPGRVYILYMVIMTIRATARNFTNLGNIKMSQSLSNLLDAIKVIKDARLKAVGVNFAWNTLYDAELHIQKQIDAHFAN